MLNSRVRLLYHVTVVLAFLLLVNFVVAGMLAQMEGLSYTDGFYLAMSTTTLAGYGNVSATTVGGKWFVSFYQLFAYAIFNYLVTTVSLSLIDRRLIEAVDS